MRTDAQGFDSTVFVIMPIGTGQEAQRHRARFDSLISVAVSQAAERAGKTLTCLRADDIEASGKITDRVVQYLSQCRIVIADLHDLNPNVMYELGVRHAVRYGTILLAPQPSAPGDKAIPFDLGSLDVVFYQDHIGQEAAPLARLVARIVKCLNDASPTPDSPVEVGDMARAQEFARAQELLRTDILESLAKRVAASLQQEPGWAAKAMATAGIGPGANTVFAHRSSHFRDEKRVIARGFVPFLMARCKQLLSRPEIKQVYLLIDAGTTLVPIAEEIAKFAQAADESETWLSQVKIYTNNLAGIEAMMEHRRQPIVGRLPALAIECHLFPGVPLAEYSAIVGDETDTAAASLCRDVLERGDTALIGLVTGNWIRMRRNREPCPVPLARGRAHWSFKQTLLSGILSEKGANGGRGEVYVVTPLGKVFVSHGGDEVLAALNSIAGSIPAVSSAGASDTDYKELEITNEMAKSVSMVATSRFEGTVLFALSKQLRANLQFKKLPTQDRFAGAPLGEPLDLLFDFNELHGVWARQLEQEFPHERTRSEEFLSLFETHLEQTR